MNRPSQRGTCTLEIPRGYADDGESSLACAQRELYEETGYRIEADKFVLLGYVRPNTGILTSRVALYAAMISECDVQYKNDNESQNIIHLKEAELSNFLINGKIEDAFTLFAITYYKLTQLEKNQIYTFMGNGGR